MTLKTRSIYVVYRWVTVLDRRWLIIVPCEVFLRWPLHLWRYISILFSLGGPPRKGRVAADTFGVVLGLPLAIMVPTST